MYRQRFKRKKKTIVSNKIWNKIITTHFAYQHTNILKMYWDLLKQFMNAIYLYTK